MNGFEWVSAEWHKVGIGLLMFDHLFRRVVEWEDDWKKARDLFGRRKGDNMSIISEIQALIKVIPQIEKVIEDAKLAEQTPQVSQMVSDLQIIVAEVKGLLANPTPTSTTPPAAAS